MTAKGKAVTRARARDPGTLLKFSAPVWICCPRCSGPARIKDSWIYIGQSAQLTCIACHYKGGLPAHGVQFAGEPTRQVLRVPRCFNCGGWLPRRFDGRAKYHKGQATGRVKCPGCGHADDYPLFKMTRYSVPLYLSVSVGRWTLWAWNPAQIDALETWLSASLRERNQTPYYRTMMAYLPQWMKLASNRQAVLKGLARLRANAIAAGIK